jgi:hypothetical protein
MEQPHPVIAFLLSDITSKEATTFDEVLVLLQAEYILREIHMGIKYNHPVIQPDGLSIRKEILKPLLGQGFSFWRHNQSGQEYLFLPGVSAEKWFIEKRRSHEEYEPVNLW